MGLNLIGSLGLVGNEKKSNDMVLHDTNAVWVARRDEDRVTFSFVIDRVRDEYPVYE